MTSLEDFFSNPFVDAAIIAEIGFYAAKYFVYGEILKPLNERAIRVYNSIGDSRRAEITHKRVQNYKRTAFLPSPISELTFLASSYSHGNEIQGKEKEDEHRT